MDAREIDERQAQALGPDVLNWVNTLLQSKSHPEQAYRVCLGLLNLHCSYPAERLNQACPIANREALFRLQTIRAILQSNRDQMPGRAPSQALDYPQIMKIFARLTAFIKIKPAPQQTQTTQLSRPIKQAPEND